MKSYYLTLLRHGLAEGESEGRYIGDTDAPLTREGKQQLCDLRGALQYPHADALFTSPLARCRETAALLYPDAKPIVLDGLREYYFGEYENKTPPELEDHPLYHRWLAGEPGLTPPFAEALEDFQDRIFGTFTKLVGGLLKTGTTHAVVVTHGGIIMALLARFGLPEAEMHEWLTPGGCGFLLRITPMLWSGGEKLEVVAMAPEEPEDEDELPPERSLWLELEEPGLV
ncbi:MAG: histidine phosphatase family protein [Oscillospiraceae bacterium]|jgi:alpha-ribazole phosphatase|nr:histidine phosphatase family protein [Oscillospiraceae bacterium]